MINRELIDFYNIRMKRFKINGHADLYSFSKEELEEIISLITNDLTSEIGNDGELTKNGILLDDLIGEISQVLIRKYGE